MLLRSEPPHVGLPPGEARAGKGVVYVADISEYMSVFAASLFSVYIGQLHSLFCWLDGFR